MKRDMAYRLKWLLILAFAVAQFSMASGASAFAAPVAAMENCDGTADHCCDFGGMDHCSACVACAGLISLASYSTAVNVLQIHDTATPCAFSSSILTVEPPPPR
jgi:hypothetical protein